jgi:alkyl hydroperoxide reductase subunit AhpC
VLSFLAPGCTDCAQEVAALTRAWEGFKDRGVDVLVVDLGGGPLNQAAAYYRSLGGADYLYATDPGFRVAQQYRVVALDTTVIVDPAGTVTFRDEVSTSPATLARALQKAVA